MATNVSSRVPTIRKIVNRWAQMCATTLARMASANLQYAWTLFTKPLTSSLHASLAAIQFAFTMLIASQRRLVPVEGYIPDRASPRVAIAIGDLPVGASWVGTGLEPWCAGSS